MHKLIFAAGMFACIPLLVEAEQAGRARRTFEAELIMAAADDDRLKEWAADRSGVALESLTEFRPGQPVVAQARVRGCDPGDVGRCDVTVQYAVYGPDGQVYHQAAAQRVDAGQPAANLTWTFSNTDPTGLYRVVVIARDLNAKRIIRTERIFGLRPVQDRHEGHEGNEGHEG
jgi:hypothetical protein